MICNPLNYLYTNLYLVTVRGLNKIEIGHDEMHTLKIDLILLQLILCIMAFFIKYFYEYNYTISIFLKGVTRNVVLKKTMLWVKLHNLYFSSCVTRKHIFKYI